MRPIDAHTGRSIAISCCRHAAGIDVRQQAGPVANRGRGVRQVMQRALESMGIQPLARRAVAQLRTFAQA